MTEPLHKKDDKHLTVRISPKLARKADKVVEKAWKEDLHVMGRSHPIRVKHSHIYRLAIEVGLDNVLDRLREMQAELPTEEEV